MTAMLPANLTETLNRVGAVAQALADEVRSDREQRVERDESERLRQEQKQAAEHDRRRREARRLMIALVVIGVLVASMLTLGVSNRVLSNQNRELVESVKDTNDRILDCTDPAGDCRREGDARTAGAVQGAIRGYIAVAQCQRATNTDAELEECVMRKLEGPQVAPSPSG